MQTSKLPPAKTDISVLLLFFNRPETLRQTFASIREARPSRLFLYQDGPRSKADLPRMEECRRIVSEVDWECVVEQNYQQTNSGCDPSNYNAQQWAFSLTDKCAVFEDDDVVSPSLLPFFKEMLDLYEHDERVGMIAGFNPDNETADVSSDYFFTRNFSIWGWASWRRVVSRWDDGSYSFLDNPAARRLLQQTVSEHRLRKDFLPMAEAHKRSGKAYYETIFYAALLLNSQLAIVPRVNMVQNIGAQAESTHFAADLNDLPPGYRRLFTLSLGTLDFPLRHPDYVAEHIPFRHRVYRIYGWNHPFLKARRSLWELLHNLRKGNFRRITGALSNRLRIIFKGKDYV